MELGKTLDAVEMLAKAMQEQDPVERLQTYAAISRLLDEIESYSRNCEEKGEDVGYARIHIAEMLEPLAGLAGIGLYGPERSADCITWILQGVQKLRKDHPFSLRV